jgi:hypothetical protein
MPVVYAQALGRALGHCLFSAPLDSGTVSRGFWPGASHLLCTPAISISVAGEEGSLRSPPELCPKKDRAASTEIRET